VPVADLYNFHEYPPQWYSSTLQNDGNNAGGGYAWAIDQRGVNGSAFPSGQYFEQASNETTPMVLQSISQAQAQNLIANRDSTNANLINTYSRLIEASNYIAGPLQAVGNVTDAIRQEATGVIGSRFGLQLLLGGASFDEQSNGARTSATPAIQAVASPSYTWIPINIPHDAQFVSFNFEFEDVNPNDLLTVGIGDSQLFALEGQYVPNDELENSGVLDVSQWAGQSVDLFFGNSGIAANGTMVIQDLTFESVPEPHSILLVIIPLILLRRHDDRQARMCRDKASLSW
jgi:hypothetical protein